MTDSSKIRVLKAIQLMVKVPNPRELQAALGIPAHDVVHLIYSLQKQHFVTFKLTAHPPDMKARSAKRGFSRKVPVDIRITPRGEEFLARRQE